MPAKMGLCSTPFVFLSANKEAARSTDASLREFCTRPGGEVALQLKMTSPSWQQLGECSNASNRSEGGGQLYSPRYIGANGASAELKPIPPIRMNSAIPINKEKTAFLE